MENDFGNLIRRIDSKRSEMEEALERLEAEMEEMAKALETQRKRLLKSVNDELASFAAATIEETKREIEQSAKIARTRTKKVLEKLPELVEKTMKEKAVEIEEEIDSIRAKSNGAWLFVLLSIALLVGLLAGMLTYWWMTQPQPVVIDQKRIVQGTNGELFYPLNPLLQNKIVKIPSAPATPTK